MPARGPGGLLRWAAALALASMASHAAAGAATAQQGAPAAAEDKAKKSDATTGSQATLKVRVLLVDPEGKQAPQNAENATVKVKGGENTYRTAKDGTTRAVAIAPGVKTLIVRVSGANPCNDVTVSVKEGEQVVTVLVEQVPEVNCTLQPQRP